VENRQGLCPASDAIKTAATNSGQEGLKIISFVLVTVIRRFIVLAGVAANNPAGFQTSVELNAIEPRPVREIRIRQGKRQRRRIARQQHLPVHQLVDVNKV